MEVLNTRQMTEADRRTIEDLGIPARTLMESAGRAVAEVVAGHLDDRPQGPVLILAGRGGNGGDGLVALRTLATRGYRATAAVLAPVERLSPDTLANFRAARRLGLDLVVLPDAATWEEAVNRGGPGRLAGAPPAVIVDAVLGTGVRGALRGLPARVLTDLQRLPRFHQALRVAVDLPTGLDADSGVLPALCFRADCTVALAAPKVCHVVFPASSTCGALRVAEIGIPPSLLSAGEAGVVTFGTPEARGFFPRRAPGVKKGDLGRVLLIAGSKRMPGAAALAARGALGAGVGLLTVATPESAPSALPPEAMRLPLPDEGSGRLTSAGLPRIEAFPADALAVGPGLGSAAETRTAVRRLVLGNQLPLVLDADGLNAFSGRAGELAARTGLALTPHAGEAARLLGETPEDISHDRLAAVRRLARRTGNAVALTGPGTLTAAPERTVLVNQSGGPELAAGGTGDVLTGIVAALLARGLAPNDALAAGVFVHGAAGEAARRRLSADAVTASAVADRLGAAIRRLRRGRTE